MSRTMGVTEAQRNFSDVINRVAYQDEAFTLIRGGRPVARLSPVAPTIGLAELPVILGALPSLGPDEARAFLAELEGGRRDADPAVPASGSGGAEAARDGGDGPGQARDADEDPGEAPPDAPAESPGLPGVLLDATILLGHEAGRLDLPARLQGREEVAFRVSVITMGELFRAVERTPEPLSRTRRGAWVQAASARLPLLPGDLPSARAHAELWTRLLARGTRIGPHDLWLVAACAAHGFTLATLNPGRFAGVEGLEVEDWGPLPAT